MAEIQDLDPTDANNTGRWPEGMLGGQINDAGRAMEGYLARWYRDTSGFLAAGGSSNAFTLTSSRTIASLTDGLTMTFRANHSITGAATLNLNTLGAKDIRRFNGDPLAQGDVISGQPVAVIYSSALDDWIMLTAPAALTGNMFVDLEIGATPSVPAAGDVRFFAHTDGYVAAIDNGGGLTFMWPPATQAVMEAATSPAHAVTPEVLRFHPGVAKASGRGGSAGGIVGDSFNVSSVTRNSTGNYTVALSVTFASTDQMRPECTSLLGGDQFCSVQILSTSSFRVFHKDSANGNDDGDFSFSVYGTLA